MTDRVPDDELSDRWKPPQGPRDIAVVDLDRGSVRRRPRRATPGACVGTMAVVVRNSRPLAVVQLGADTVDDDQQLLTRARDAVRDMHDVPVITVDDRAPREPITIVIATRDRAEHIGTTIDRMAAMVPGPEAIVVVDNASKTDATHAAITDAQARWPGLVAMVREPVPGLSRARNRGLEAVTTPLVLFADDDIEPEGDYLGRFADRFAGRPDIWCVSGVVLPAELSTPAHLLFEQFGGYWSDLTPRDYWLTMPKPPTSLFPFSPGLFGTGASLAFRTDAIRRLGGFDVRLGAGTASRGGEDLDVTIRVILNGGVLATEPGALCWHPSRDTVAGLERLLEGYGCSIGAVAAKLISRPRTALAVIRRAPAAVRHLVRPDSPKLAGRPADYPRRLARRELIGVCRGPYGYLRSVVSTPHAVEMRPER